MVLTVPTGFWGFETAAKVMHALRGDRVFCPPHRPARRAGREREPRQRNRCDSCALASGP